MGTISKSLSEIKVLDHGLVALTRIDGDWLSEDIIEPASDWEEITDEQFNEIRDLIKIYNMNPDQGYFIKLIESVTIEIIKLDLNLVVEKLRKNAKAVEARRVAQEKRNKEAEAKRELDKIARKKRQLAKLQAELAAV